MGGLNPELIDVPDSARDALGAAIRRGIDQLMRSPTPSRRGGTLVLRPGVWRWDLAQAAEIPVGIELWMLPGARITLVDSRSVPGPFRIRGRLRAGLHAIFSSDSVSPVAFGPNSVSVIRPEWWALDDRAPMLDARALRESLRAALASGEMDLAVVELSRSVSLDEPVVLSPAGGDARVLLRGLATLQRTPLTVPPAGAGGSGLIGFQGALSQTTRASVIRAMPAFRARAGAGDRGLLELNGFANIAFEHVVFDGAFVAAHCAVLNAPATSAGGEGVRFEGCEFRGANLRSILLAGTPVNATMAVPVTLRNCLLAGEDVVPGFVVTNVAGHHDASVSVRSSAWKLVCEGCWFVGGALAFVRATGARVDLTGCVFDNSLVPPDGVDVTAAQGGVDVFLEDAPLSSSIPMAALHARMCRSRSSIFLARREAKATGAVRYSESTLLHVTHEPGYGAAVPSIFWAGQGGFARLALIACTLRGIGSVERPPTVFDAVSDWGVVRGIMPGAAKEGLLGIPFTPKGRAAGVSSVPAVVLDSLRAEVRDVATSPLAPTFGFYGARPRTVANVTSLQLAGRAIDLSFIPIV